jgi:hypothetical protein
MNQIEQIGAFTRELLFIIDRYQTEFDMPIETLIGVLEGQKAVLLDELIDFGIEIDIRDLLDDEDIPD